MTIDINILILIGNNVVPGVHVSINDLSGHRLTSEVSGIDGRAYFTLNEGTYVALAVDDLSTPTYIGSMVIVVSVASPKSFTLYLQPM